MTPIRVPMLSNISTNSKVRMIGRALAKSCRSRSKFNWNIVGSGEAGRSTKVAGIVVTVPPEPLATKSPTKVTAKMERMMARDAPGHQRNGEQDAAEAEQHGWRAEIAACVTKVAGLATTRPPFFSPMKAMKRPMPQVMASFSWCGMAAMIFSRTPVTDRPRKMSPLTKTRPSADCHETPKPRQMVKAK